MSSSKFMLSLIGSSILRNHKTLNPLPPILPLRFLSPTPSPLRFNRNCSSSAVIQHSSDTLTSGGTEVSLLPPLVNHPWPEWVNFIDRLKTKGYLSETSTTAATTAPPRTDVESGGDVDEGAALYTDGNLLKHACLNFARDRFDILKSLSAQDLQTIVEKGCPSLFRKVVNSAKRLRAHLQLDEGEVCGSCNLRGSCDRAYVILSDSEASARTVDIVRILLLYALDPVVISGGPKPPGGEDIEASARKLLSELIELSDTTPDPELPKTSLPKPSAKAPRQKEFLHVTDDRSYQNVEMKKGDWMCSECNFLNFARNMRCLKCSAEGPKRVADDIEMKKGDWTCSECGIINFASRMKCFRCSQQRPKRQLNPGEWECPSCNFLNYRRNTVCKKCNCDRPKDVDTGYDRPKDVDTGYGQQTWKKPFSNKF